MEHITQNETMQQEIGVDIDERGIAITPVRSTNLTNIRRHYFRYMKSLAAYLSSSDETEMLSRMMGNDQGKTFIIAETDRLIGRLGYPVKTKSASQKAWKHVFGN